MAIEVPKNEEISKGGKNRGRKGVSFAICWRGVNRGAYTLTLSMRLGLLCRSVAWQSFPDAFI